MKTRVYQKAVIVGVVWLVFGTNPASAQLAITEVMSRAALKFGTKDVLPGPDYWELSNFGTNDMDLTGYGFSDSDLGVVGADTNAFLNLTIKAGESIIFFESFANTIAVESFRAWWGLRTNVQVIPYTNVGYGFSSAAFGDGIRLWGPSAIYNANDADVIDSVDFGAATRGQSFTYDPITGQFGVLSSLSHPGVFRAVTADDIGSPGTNSGAVKLSFVTHPTNRFVNPGDTVTFGVGFRGLPRPSFQWFHNGAPIAGARFPTYTVESVQGEHAGTYEVALSNIFEVRTSSPAILTLNTTSVPPTIIERPTEFRVFVDQNAFFQCIATGLPQPTYRWRKNGVAIPGETRRLDILGWHEVGTNVYSVIVSNLLGSITNEALLIVTERPNLWITELMPSEREAPGLGHADWWELTNFGTNAVDLFGYRFDDFTDVIGQAQRPHLELAWTITNHIIIQPEESVVFSESEPDVFRYWWGWANLPPDLQIITYSGSLGFSAVRADGLALWNMGATRDDDVVNKYTRVSYSELSISFGVSFTATPDGVLNDPCCEILSEIGINGAFVSAESGDIGSPGYVSNPTDPRILSLTLSLAGCHLTWRSVLPGNYRVQYRERLDEGIWLNLDSVAKSGPTTTYVDASARGVQQRFYRVIPSP